MIGALVIRERCRPGTVEGCSTVWLPRVDGVPDGSRYTPVSPPAVTTSTRLFLQTPPPHPHLGAITQQVGQRTELIGCRKRQTAGGIDETGDWHSRAGQGGGAQLGCRTVVVRRRPGGDRSGPCKQDSHHGDDDGPAPHGAVSSSHPTKGTEHSDCTMAQ